LKLPDRCRHLRNPIAFITRLRLDAVLYEPTPPREPGQIERPRLKGSRLPNLSRVVEDPTTAWKSISVSGWYGGAERTVEIVSDKAVRYSTGLPAVPVRWGPDELWDLSLSLWGSNKYPYVFFFRTEKAIINFP
jgi:hypothetical protein